jgi:hypothetical protein
MDAFEEIVAGLFRQMGYWTRLNYKVNLEKADKVRVGKPSLPRPEIDVLAYRPTSNSLLWIECKSYLDSKGVIADAFNGKNQRAASRYKIFTDETYREVASNKLLEQTVDEGLVLPGAILDYCLVAGKIDTKSQIELQEHFTKKGWMLFDRTWIKDKLRELSTLGYENDIAIVIAKLLERK